MLKFESTVKFQKDIKRIKKQGLDITKIHTVVDMLLARQKLPEKLKDHALHGRYEGCRECHIQPDLLLIYSVDGKRLILTAIRTGSHSELF